MTESELENWVVKQREVVIQYLQAQNVDHAGVGEWPAWEVAPYFAIWAVQSNVAPGQVGWWAFSGDIPTDYISGENIPDPRVALEQLLKSWHSHIPHLKRGENPPGITLGNAKNRQLLGDLLERRIRILAAYYEDDALWDELLDQTK
jgi:hypothetical protein